MPNIFHLKWCHLGLKRQDVHGSLFVLKYTGSPMICKNTSRGEKKTFLDWEVTLLTSPKSRVRPALRWPQAGRHRGGLRPRQPLLLRLHPPHASASPAPKEQAKQRDSRIETWAPLCILSPRHLTHGHLGI